MKWGKTAYKKEVGTGDLCEAKECICLDHSISTVPDT